MTVYVHLTKKGVIGGNLCGCLCPSNKERGHRGATCVTACVLLTKKGATGGNLCGCLCPSNTGGEGHQRLAPVCILIGKYTTSVNVKSQGWIHKHTRGFLTYLLAITTYPIYVYFVNNFYSVNVHCCEYPSHHIITNGIHY